MNLATMRAFFKYVEQIEYAMGLNFTAQSRSHRLSAVVACYSVDTVCSLLGVVRVPTAWATGRIGNWSAFGQTRTSFMAKR